MVYVYVYDDGGINNGALRFCYRCLEGSSLKSM
jgi:hypothetical protein